MPPSEARLVVLSGPLGAGKSTLAARLGRTLGAKVVRAREVITAHRPEAVTREALLVAGAQLEAAAPGRWLADAVDARLADTAQATLVVLDSARTAAQLQALKQLTGSVTAVHLTANDAERRRRYQQHWAGKPDDFTFERASEHPTEAGADSLRGAGDLVIDTSTIDPDIVFRLVATYLSGE